MLCWDSWWHNNKSARWRVKITLHDKHYRWIRAELPQILTKRFMKYAEFWWLLQQQVVLEREREQLSQQSKMLAAIISANQRCILICMWHMFTSHVSWPSCQEVEVQLTAATPETTVPHRVPTFVSVTWLSAFRRDVETFSSCVRGGRTKPNWTTSSAIKFKSEPKETAHISFSDCSAVTEAIWHFTFLALNVVRFSWELWRNLIIVPWGGIVVFQCKEWTTNNKTINRVHHKCQNIDSPSVKNGFECNFINRGRTWEDWQPVCVLERGTCFLQDLTSHLTDRTLCCDLEPRTNLNFTFPTDRQTVHNFSPPASQTNKALRHHLTQITTGPAVAVNAALSPAQTLERATLRATSWTALKWMWRSHLSWSL